MDNVRTYYGVNIYPRRVNSMGCRWEAFVPGHRYVMADTLAGIKTLIRRYLGK